MIEDIVTVDKMAAERPILLPDHPYLAALKDFGLDELVAGGIDPLSTTLVNHFIAPDLRTKILPFCGPVLEKIGFFPAHFFRAKKIYNTTPEKVRKNLGSYFKQGIKDGMTNMVDDIMWHDPLYIGMMWAGLTYTPDIPPGILSLMSYITAVLLVSGIKVGRAELAHSRVKNSLKKAGYMNENYYESRFYVLREKNPQIVFDDISKEFGLENIGSAKYYDSYFENTIPVYSGRTARLRMRTRESRPFDLKWVNNTDWINSVQIVYTRAREQGKGVDQCRYFPVRKEKLYAMLPGNVKSLDDIPDPLLKEATLKMQDKSRKVHHVSFERTVARDGELAICTDKVDSKNPFYVIEMKVYKDTHLLQQAMRYLMVECPIAVVQTTYGKSDLVSF